MLSLGQHMNGFRIASIIGLQLGDKPDGAYVLGQRTNPPVNGGHMYSWVVAYVEQRLIDTPEPAQQWSNGSYFEMQVPSDADEVSTKALRYLMERSGVEGALG